MQKTELAAACGIYCGDCEYINDKCPGCNQTQGKPFWTASFNIDVCPIFGCCAGEKRLEHCGLCDEFPCETFTSLRDPSMSEGEAEQSLSERQLILSRRREIGTEAWLREYKKQE